MDADTLRTLVIIGTPMLLTFLVYLVNRNNPNAWYNRVKRYDELEKRVKALEREKTTKNPPEKL